MDTFLIYFITPGGRTWPYPLNINCYTNKVSIVSLLNLNCYNDEILCCYFFNVNYLIDTIFEKVNDLSIDFIISKTIDHL